MNDVDFFVICWLIASYLLFIILKCFDNPEPNSTPKKPVSPPPGFKNDNALINYDYSMGVPKSEIKRREAIGYYLKPCDKYGCVYPKIAGLPPAKCAAQIAEILKAREENECKEQESKGDEA